MYWHCVVLLQKLGKLGADGILAELAARRGGSEGGKVRVLTHCNTGSLATAAYGTALGVVRGLHEAGRLEHAFCTETRPYNQGKSGPSVCLNAHIIRALYKSATAVSLPHT